MVPLIARDTTKAARGRKAKATLADESDHDLGARFLEQATGGIYYIDNQPTKDWITYDAEGHQWLPGETHAATFLKETLLSDGLDVIKNSHKQSSVLKDIRGDRRVSATKREVKFDNEPHLLNFRNGVLDLREYAESDKTTGFYPHESHKWAREKLLTRRVNADWKPDAEAPHFRNLLFSIMGYVDGSTEESEPLVDYLLRCLGVTITGDTSFRVGIVIEARGNNGKDLLLSRILSPIFGAYMHTTAREMWIKTSQPLGQNAHTSHLLSLQGSRLWLAPEFNQDDTFDEAIFQRLTGNGEVTARAAHSPNDVTFMPQGTPWFITNHVIQFNTNSAPMRNRLVILNFPCSFYEKDSPEYELAMKDPERQPWVRTAREGLEYPILKEERSGVMKMLVDGYCECRKRNIRVDIPGFMRAKREEYIEKSDPLTGWLKTCCDTNDLTGMYSTQARDLLDSLNAYIGDPKTRISQRKLSDLLKGHGYESYQSGGKIRYKGIKLLDPLDPPSPSDDA